MISSITELLPNCNTRNRVKFGDDILCHDEDDHDDDRMDNRKCSRRDDQELDSEEIALVSFGKLPEWLQCNPHLHSMHRAPCRSLTECARSLFYVHSETGNIWSHLLTCTAFVYLAGEVLGATTHEYSQREKWALAPFLLGQIVCYGMSTLYHLLSCHSEKVCVTFCTLDYAGIVVSLLGAAISSMQYLWWCRPGLSVVYCFLYTIVASACVAMVVWGRLSQREYRSLRAVVFFMCAMTGLFALAHDMLVDGFWQAVYNYPLGRLTIIFFLAVAGVVFYVFHLPESLFPGKFDVWFQSHQLFHVMASLASFVAYNAMMSMVQLRRTTQCPRNY